MRMQNKEEHIEIEGILEIVNWIDMNKSTYLRNAREVKKWMEERETTKPPAGSSYDEEERRLGNALSSIRQNVIKPYMLLTDDEKEKYKEEHPEIEEILKIVNWIDANKSAHLRNAREIKKWMKERKTTKPPAGSSYDEEERMLANALSNIRKNIIKPYMLLTENEKKKYKEEHPEIEEILKIVNWIDANKNANLRNARTIKKWMKVRKTRKPPAGSSYNEEERRLGNALSSIRKNIIKPYMILADEEKEKYKEEHPEIDEILAIIREIDLHSPRRKELGKLVQEDLSKRNQLEEAIKLEKEYETQLERSKYNEKEGTYIEIV